MEKSLKPIGLSGNALKIIALLTMTCDHVGLQLFPDVEILRIIGRLALPIFAYMIAEGCRYTKNRKKYLLTIMAFAFVCQIVYLIAMGSLYQCILVTFSLSIVLIYVLDDLQKDRSIRHWLPAGAAVISVCFLAEILPLILDHTDYAIDYGIWGILLPVFIYIGTTKGSKLLFAALSLTCLALDSGGIQWFALCAIPLLALYNGTRGKGNMKYLFYIYYPLHLVVIYGIRLIFR